MRNSKPEASAISHSLFTDSLLYADFLKKRESKFFPAAFDNLWGFCEGSSLYRPAMAPYTGQETISSLISDADRLRIIFSKKQIRRISIKLPPSSLLSIDPLKELSSHYDVQISGVELSAVLDLRKEISFHKMQQRKLQKSAEAGFFYSNLYSQNMGDAFYDLLVKERANKGFPTSIVRQRLHALLQEFPENYCLRTLSKNGKLVAGFVGVKLSEELYYYFLPVHDHAYDAFSPMVLLLQKCIEELKADNYRYFDLGISSVNGRINKGLTRFKKRLGARLSRQYTFQLNLMP